MLAFILSQMAQFSYFIRVSDIFYTSPTINPVVRGMDLVGPGFWFADSIPTIRKSDIPYFLTKVGEEISGRIKWHLIFILVKCGQTVERQKL
jgi:hypothetical protein